MHRIRSLLMTSFFFAMMIAGCGGGVNAPPYETSDPVDDTQRNFGATTWARLLGSDREEFARAMVIADDGNIYITGYTQGDYETLSNNGNIDGVDSRTDVFVSKLNKDGRILWHKLYGTAANDAATSIALTPDGGIVIGGTTTASMTSQPNRGYTDAFISKIDADGNLLWSAMLASDYTDWVSNLTVDALGNTYILGVSFGDIEGLQNHSLHTIDPKKPITADFFLAKLNSDGGKLWTLLEGDMGNDYGNELAADNAGHLIIAGATFPYNSLGNTDAFLTQFDPASQTFLWRVAQVTGAADSNDVLAIDSQNNIYVGGLSDATPFVKQYNSLGQILQSNLIPASTESNSIAGVAVDAAGNVFITGTRRSLTQEELAGSGSTDIYVKEFPSNGRDIPAVTYGGPESDDPAAIAISPTGDIYICGGSDGTLYDQTGHGMTDALLMQLARP